MIAHLNKVLVIPSFWISPGVTSPGSCIFSMGFDYLDYKNTLSSSTAENYQTLTSGSFSTLGEYYVDGPGNYTKFGQRPAFY